MYQKKRFHDIVIFFPNPGAVLGSQMTRCIGMRVAPHPKYRRGFRIPTWWFSVVRKKLKDFTVWMHIFIFIPFTCVVRPINLQEGCKRISQHLSTNIVGSKSLILNGVIHLLFGGFSITKGYNSLFIRIHPGHVANRYHKKRWASEKATPLNYSYMALHGFATFQAIKLLRNITDLVVPKYTYWWFRNPAPPEMYKPLQIVGLLPIECCRSSEPSTYWVLKVRGERKLRVKPNISPSTNGK